MGWLHGERQRMRTEVAALQRRLDEAASVRSDRWHRPRRRTVIDRVKGVLRGRRDRTPEPDSRE